MVGRGKPQTILCSSLQRCLPAGRLPQPTFDLVNELDILLLLRRMYGSACDAKGETHRGYARDAELGTQAAMRYGEYAT